MRTVLAGLSLLGSALCSAACSGEGAATEEVWGPAAAQGDAAGFHTSRSFILAGQPSPSGTADDAVVMLRSGATDPHVCTGTLVASNLVLTARHCVAFLNEGEFRCDESGNVVDNPTGGGLLGLDFAPKDVAVYAGELPTEPVAYATQIVSSLTPTICANDIAFVVLDRKLELPRKALRLHTRTAVGEPVNLIGYGLSETMNPNWRENPRHRFEGQRVTNVGPESLQQGVASVPPRTVVVVGPSACFGDSGGPLLASSSDAVLGVYSLAKGTDCAAPNVEHFFTDVSAFDVLAERAFAAAEASAWLEGAPDPNAAAFGGACSAPHDCASGLCVAMPAGDTFCSSDCAESDCPTEHTCDPELLVCLPAAPPSRDSDDEESGCTVASDLRSGSARVDGSVWSLLLFGAVAITRRQLRRFSDGRRADRHRATSR